MKKRGIPTRGMKPMIEQLLTLDEVGQILKIKTSAVYELTRERSQKKQSHPIPFIKVAGKVRFSKEAIHLWLLKLQGRTV
jgi:predicted DNA-binding transcriptional regulator AlpA